MLKNRYKQATIQMNNLEAVKTLIGKDMDDLGIIILRRAQRIMRFEGQWRIQHVPRGKNLWKTNWLNYVSHGNQAYKPLISLLMKC